MPGSLPNAIIDQKTKKIITQVPMPVTKYIAIEGGGVRGAAYAGAFNILAKYHFLDQVEHVAGTSVGSMAALLIALGYSAQEAAQELYTMPIEAFLEASKPWSTTPQFFTTGKKILSVLMNKKAALSSGNKLTEWIETHVEAKLGNKKATFADLAKAIAEQKNKGETRFRYLYVTATNISITIPECEVFSHETTPQATLAEAVRFSSTFPFIFESVNWGESSFLDGGLRRNLPAKIFDEKRFLLPGYQFTDKGANPSTLSLKIDSTTEINQVVWGIKKRVPVEGVRAQTFAIYNAIAESIDPTEIREARMVLPLRDNDIDSLNFTIDTEGRIRLISSAEETTQEFLENYINAAYEVKSYDTLKDWLASLDLEDIDNLIVHYNKLRNDLLTSKTEVPTEPAAFDPNHPTLSDLEHYIAFLEKYDAYRRAAKRDPSVVLDVPFPENHINIKPEKNQSIWCERLQKDMTDRINAMERYIKITDMKIKLIHVGFSRERYNTLPEKLHDDDIFSYIKTLTGHLEYRKVLTAEKSDLEMKLGLKPTRLDPATFNLNLNEYIAFIKQFSLSQDGNSPLDVIIKKIDLYHPVMAYESMSRVDNILFTIDLRHHYDFQIFIIAATLYLEHRKAKEHALFVGFFAHLFPDTPFPKNMSTLSDTLGLLGVNLQVAAFQIEELINHFILTEQPKKKAFVSIDSLFNKGMHLTLPWIEKNTSDSGTSIAMRSFFKTHPERYTDPSIEEKHLNQTEKELGDTLDRYKPQL